MNTNNEEKFKIFLEITKSLNKRFNIIPVLYGSLGLSRVIEKDIVVNDIDILVPNGFIKNRWKDLFELMVNSGFELKNEREHEFVRKSHVVAFATDNDLTEKSGEKPENLEISTEGHVKFKQLTPELYFNVYQSVLTDGYRQEKRGSADKDKIEMIKEYLAAKNKRNL